MTSQQEILKIVVYKKMYRSDYEDQKGKCVVNTRLYLSFKLECRYNGIKDTF
jgi:hypothetical protein